MRGALARNIVPEPNSGCWIWIGGYGGGKGEYGRAWYNGRNQPAHKAVFIELGGFIPDGMELDHTCRTPCCVNPDHLEPVTHRENVDRSNNAASINSRKTHCVSGHKLDGANLMISRGKRCCRECYRRWRREWSARNASTS